MAPSADVDLAAVDYYELLAIPATATESEIRRAYRKTSLLYHPDKVTPTPETLEKFQLLQTALSILSDASERTKYDQTREAKQRRKAENEALESRRRKMKEDLESREAGDIFDNGANANTSGTKRSWSERELEIKRIAEENRKRRENTIARKKKEAQMANEAAATAQKARDTENGIREEPTQDDTMDRSVKVRWIKEGDGLDIDDSALTDMFPAGEVENVVILKDKKRRIDGRDRKVVLGTAVLVFSTLGAAKRAVAGGATDELSSIEWAKGKGDDPE